MFLLFAWRGGCLVVGGDNGIGIIALVHAADHGDIAERAGLARQAEFGMVAPAFDEIAFDRRRLRYLATHHQHAARPAQRLATAELTPGGIVVGRGLEHGRAVPRGEALPSVQHADRRHSSSLSPRRRPPSRIVGVSTISSACHYCPAKRGLRQGKVTPLSRLTRNRSRRSKNSNAMKATASGRSISMACAAS